MHPKLDGQRDGIATAAADHVAVDVEGMRDAYGAVAVVLGALRPAPRMVDDRAVTVR
jgi:hypothetical protein